MAYCERVDVEGILSQFGIDHRIDDDEDAAIAAEEEAFLTQSIDEGTAQINFYMYRYRRPTLVGNEWLRHCNAYLAACNVSLRRVNGVHPDLATRCNRYYEQLADIKEGLCELPANDGDDPLVPEAESLGPLKWVQTQNYIVRMGHLPRQVQIDHDNSTGKSLPPGLKVP
jgi:hypothetical protein